MGKEGEEEGGSMKTCTQTGAQVYWYSSTQGGEKTLLLFMPFHEGKAYLPPKMTRRTRLGCFPHSISSVGYEWVQSKNPTCLFEVAHTFQFVDFHTEVFHMYGNWLFNAWTELSAQTIAVAKWKQRYRILTQKFLQKLKLIIPSITHTSCHNSPKGFPLCKPP